MVSSAYQAELEAVCPEGWKVVPLTDVVIFQEGPGILAKDFQDSGVPLIRLKGVEGDFVSLEGCNFLAPEKVARKWSHFRLERGDLVISTSASFGCVSEVTGESEGAVPYTGLIRFRPKTKELDAGFLRAFLGSSAFMQQVEAMASGSVIRHFGPMHIKQMALPLPPIGEQHAIGNIAKLIAERLRNQSQANETLESMARTLFKAWFVDFEPVRAKMEGRWQRGQSLPGLPAHTYDLFPNRIVESELGEIPERWKMTSLSEFSSLNPESWTMRTRPQKIRYVDLSNTKWGRVESVTNYVSDDAPSRAQRVLRPLDTIVGTVRPGNGSYALISDEGLTGSTGFAVLRPLRHECSEFVYLAATARENIERLSNLADGGAYPAVRSEIVSATQVPRASQELINEFSRQVCSVIASIADNERTSNSLAQLRDTLLPKLISGELRIHNAEAFLKERGL